MQEIEQHHVNSKIFQTLVEFNNSHCKLDVYKNHKRILMFAHGGLLIEVVLVVINKFKIDSSYEKIRNRSMLL